jgi:Glutaredoxin-like domain (DUF836)
MISMTLYSRPECHLCDAMLAELEPLLSGRATVEVVDISDDDDLEVRYGLRIPVLVAGDSELAVYRLDKSRVEQFLAHLD